MNTIRWDLLAVWTGMFLFSLGVWALVVHLLRSLL